MIDEEDGGVEQLMPAGDDPVDTGRRLDMWDALGILALAFLGAAGAALIRTGGEPLGTLTWILLVAFLSGLLLTVGVAWQRARRLGLRTSRLPALLTRVWTEPPRDRMMFLFGFLVALPVMALHTRMMTSLDADSARIASSVRFVQQHGIDYLVRTQENFLPHLLLGPALRIGGLAGAMGLSVLSVQALAGTVSYVTWRINRRTMGALAGALVVLSIPALVERAVVLPLYPPMLAFGVLGVFLAFRTINGQGRRRVMLAAGSAFSFILSIESHQVGQLFLLLPPLLILVSRIKPWLSGVALVYALAAVMFVPRLIVNLLDGGFSFFLLNRVDYWITEGYLATIQTEFLEYPIRLGFPEYLREFAEGTAQNVTAPLVVVVGLAILGGAWAAPRIRWFGVAVVAVLLGAMVYQRIPPFPRYQSPLLVGAALAAAGAVSMLVRRRDTSRMRRTGVAALVAGLVLGAGWTLLVQVRETRFLEGRLGRGVLSRIAETVDDETGVIGVRALHINFVDETIPTYGGQFLSEREFVTFLTWPSDEDVLEVLAARDIGWVMIHPNRPLEIAYNNTWLEPRYGERVRHVWMVSRSPRFCRILSQRGYLLYRVGGCP